MSHSIPLCFQSECRLVFAHSTHPLPVWMLTRILQPPNIEKGFMEHRSQWINKGFAKRHCFNPTSIRSRQKEGVGDVGCSWMIDRLTRLPSELQQREQQMPTPFLGSKRTQSQRGRSTEPLGSLCSSLRWRT